MVSFYPPPPCKGFHIWPAWIEICGRLERDKRSSPTATAAPACVHADPSPQKWQSPPPPFPVLAPPSCFAKRFGCLETPLRVEQTPSPETQTASELCHVLCAHTCLSFIHCPVFWDVTGPLCLLGWEALRAVHAPGGAAPVPGPLSLLWDP